jgi:hypothetical protein
MTTWEYQSFLTNGPDMEATLNAAGRQGWEAVSINAVTHKYEDSVPAGLSGITPTQWGATQYRVVMKRPSGQA